MNVTRRHFLSATPLLAPVLARGANPVGGQAKRVIYLYMRDGMSSWETFAIPAQRKNEEQPGPIGTSLPGVEISQWLPKLAPRMQHFALIRSVRTHAFHEAAEYLHLTSFEPRRTISHPCIGSVVSEFLSRNGKPAPYFRIGAPISLGQGFLSSRHAPIPILDPDRAARPAGERNPEGLDRRAAALKAVNGARTLAATARTGWDLELERAGIETALGLSGVPGKDLQRYGDNAFGKSCLLAKQLADAGAAYVEVVMDGWSPPGNYFGSIRRQCEILDSALTALLDDLRASGKLAETLLVLATPMGKSAILRTESGGRHESNQSFCALLAGGGVRPGQVIGKVVADGGHGQVMEDAISPQELNSAIAFAIGMPPEEVIFSPSRRPFWYARDTRLHALF